MKKPLLRWYRLRQRRLPWRGLVTPYRTWISEIMLQQTTVAAAIPRFERFLRRFPDVGALARASENEVLRAWAGLGYYARARNLRKAAREIVRDHGGIFPDDYDRALGLPGIGRYSAGAILSIAFGKPYPVLDGNVMRVFSRLYAIKRNIKDPATLRIMWSLAEKLVPRQRPGDWNQALMELGATVCLPQKPDCGACPISSYCVAFKRGLQDELPVAGKPRGFSKLKWTCLWIERDGRVLLWKRGKDERLLKGHWGLPEARRLKTPPGRLLKIARHAITHHRITVEVREARAPRRLPEGARWVAGSKLGDYLVSSLWAKCGPQPV